MAKRKELDILMNGELVGVWNVHKGTFQYYPSWHDNEFSRSLSLSMPLAPGNPEYRGDVVSNYFDNLLPDSDNIRRRLALKFQAKGTSAAQLLSAVGRDCVGAVQIIPKGSEIPMQQGVSGRPLDEAGIAGILRDTTSDRARDRTETTDEFRLSIAGAQEKNALLLHDGRWYVPHGATPTTHIFKLPLGLVGNMAADMSTSVENEWICSRIMHHFGIPVAYCQPMTFSDKLGEVKALVVERFDRVFNNDAGIILRLPQEDFCQALGVNSLYKYEVDGGPTALQIMDRLRFGGNPDVDSRNFFKTLIIFCLLAATDGHAKNFSIHLQQGGRYAMTPLYDVLSAHPIIGKKANNIPKQKVKLAMAVHSGSKHYHIYRLIYRQWVEFGVKLGFVENIAKQILDETLDQVDGVIANVISELPADFPAVVSDTIFTGMKALSSKLY
jgi:serine/threonine-protein kinase HipA